MHRRQLLEDLGVYENKYPAEIEVINRFTGFINSSPDCFKRSLAIGHITGSAWLLNLDMDSVLLTLHKKLDKWLQLGGHADGQTNVIKAAMKEAREESGIELIEPVSAEIFDIDIHLIPENGKDAEHYHYDVRYLLKVKLSEDFIVSSESRELAWVPINKIKNYSNEKSLLRMAEKSLHLLDYSI